MRPFFPADNDGFGTAVAIFNNTVIVGAPGGGAANSGMKMGKAYIFERSGSTWTEMIKVEPPAGVPSDLGFAGAVAVDGNRAIIGNSWEGNGGDGYAGYDVWIMVNDSTGWALEDTIDKGALFAGTSCFGCSVDIHEDTVLIGIEGFAEARFYTRTGSTWAYQQGYLNDGSITTMKLGASVSLGQNRALISKDGHGSAGLSDVVGSVRVYEFQTPPSPTDPVSMTCFVFSPFIQY